MPTSMPSASQIKDSSQSSSTVPNNEIRQLEDELSSISFLLSELRGQEGSQPNGTSDAQTSSAVPGGEAGVDIQDEEVQVLLEKLEQLHGFADGVEDRMDSLLAKLDNMLGMLDNGETKGKLEETSPQLDTKPKQEGDGVGGASSEATASPGA